MPQMNAPYLRDSGIWKKTVTLLATSARAFICFLFPAPLDQPEIWGSIQPPNSADSPKLPRPFPTGSKSTEKEGVQTHSPSLPLLALAMLAQSCARGVTEKLCKNPLL